MSFTCADCLKKPCRAHTLDELPAGCPTAAITPEEVLALYSEEEKRFLHQAALVEKAGKRGLTRVEEIMHLCHLMGYRKLGLAFCVGLSGEAATFAKILHSNGFELAAVCCKACSVPKEAIGVADCEKVRPGSFEAMCNPGFQAAYLNASGAEFTVMLGLCVGHDTVFLRHAEGPVTVLAVKDRVLAHNPLGAIYTADSYYTKLYRYIDGITPKEN